MAQKLYGWFESVLVHYLIGFLWMVKLNLESQIDCKKHYKENKELFELVDLLEVISVLRDLYCI